MHIIKTKAFRSRVLIQNREFNHDFVDHAWFSHFFTPEEVSKIRALWDDSQVISAKVEGKGAVSHKDDLRKSEIVFLPLNPSTEWIYDKLAEACIFLNGKRFKFDITGFQTQLQLAKYQDGGFFDWHMDFGSGNISNRKLSITVQLSDESEYEGGELQFMVNQNIIDAPKTQGTAVIFPSFAQHRVMPVTKGVRMSIVGWIAGPPYK